MDDCEFCQERKPIEDKESYAKIVMAKYGNFLLYDNSADEYANGRVNINYCPICGRKL